MGSWRNQGHRRQRDANEGEIVDALKAQGWHVFRIDEPADLAVYVPEASEWFMIEVKNPTTHARGKSKDTRTEAQAELHPDVQQAIGVALDPVLAIAWVRLSLES